jgi:hypothetical protein
MKAKPIIHRKLDHISAPGGQAAEEELRFLVVVKKKMVGGK